MIILSCSLWFEAFLSMEKERQLNVPQLHIQDEDSFLFSFKPICTCSTIVNTKSSYGPVKVVKFLREKNKEKKNSQLSAEIQ